MIYRGLAFDREPSLTARRAFIRARNVERNYARQLLRLADHIGGFAAGFDLEDTAHLDAFAAALDGYATVVTPWAEAVGRRMITEVDARDAKAWEVLSKDMGSALRQEIAGTDTGRVMRERLDEQVKLIRSLPTEAAKRVRELTLEGLTTGRRSSDIAKEIAATGEVTASRARTIARTEVSRTAANLTQARAESIGSVGYIWVTSHDPEVRPSHRQLDGKFIEWSKPPTVDGMVGHAGCFPNCRCWPRPQIPD